MKRCNRPLFKSWYYLFYFEYLSNVNYLIFNEIDLKNSVRFWTFVLSNTKKYQYLLKKCKCVILYKNDILFIKESVSENINLTILYSIVIIFIKLFSKIIKLLLIYEEDYKNLITPPWSVV